MRVANQLLPTLAISSAIILGACSQAGTSQSGDQTEAKQTTMPEVVAPAGQYVVDLNHADLSFSLTHLGLAPYIARFKTYQADLTLTPDDWSQSAINITIDPNSVVTGYSSDYKATHQDSKFDSWEDDLARSDRFLMADQHPVVSYKSSAVTQNPDGTLNIDGALTLRGQTHPVSMTAEVTGSTASHPFTKRGAIGFTATGQFKRSTYGMQFMQGPGLLGDVITVNFSGEFHQAAE